VILKVNVTVPPTGIESLSGVRVNVGVGLLSVIDTVGAAIVKGRTILPGKEGSPE
jgi:hypothetical protein